MDTKIAAQNNTINAGFSLLEISIVLAIIAIMAGASISYNMSNNRDMKIRVSKDKMTKIEQAITAFVTINKRLPCPANGALDLTNDTLFGVEYCPGSLSVNVGSARPSCAPGPACLWASNYIIGGALPTRALALPNDYALDAWGNKFTYAVDAGLADSAVGNNFYLQTIGGITVKDAAYNIRTDRAAYILISHGPAGYGAWRSSGRDRISDINADSDTQENAHSAAGDSNWNNIFVERENNGVGDLYDNILRYKTKSLIVLNAGYKYAGPACITARQILNNGGNNLCSDASNNPKGIYPSIYCGSILSDLAFSVSNLCPAL